MDELRAECLAHVTMSRQRHVQRWLEALVKSLGQDILNTMRAAYDDSDRPAAPSPREWTFPLCNFDPVPLAPRLDAEHLVSILKDKGYDACVYKTDGAYAIRVTYHPYMV